MFVGMCKYKKEIGMEKFICLIIVFYLFIIFLGVVIVVSYKFYYYSFEF